ncbi:hypothetical protein [uncultured Agrococcus sp.]|uniref:hypothetical protein n=1 Tax=uncultured Agrococcus sp. TaxID=382258 RepID=UPI0026008120|nr:hypothetical protein [uncultured Agrococcus sp.]
MARGLRWGGVAGCTTGVTFIGLAFFTGSSGWAFLAVVSGIIGALLGLGAGAVLAWLVWRLLLAGQRPVLVIAIAGAAIAVMIPIATSFASFAGVFVPGGINAVMLVIVAAASESGWLGSRFGIYVLFGALPFLVGVLGTWHTVRSLLRRKGACASGAA